MEDENRKKQAELAALKEKSKPKEELIVPLDCLVLSSTTTTYHRSITLSSEIRIGHRSPQYNAGSIISLELEVKTNSPVKILQYNGVAPLEAGDQIRAYTLKAKEISENDTLDPFGIVEDDFGFSHNPTFWIERDYQEQEETHKIEKIRDGKVVATYEVK